MIIGHNYFMRVMLQNLVSVFDLVLGNLRETGTIEGVYAGKAYSVPDERKTIAHAIANQQTAWRYQSKSPEMKEYKYDKRYTNINHICPNLRGRAV